jgi:hypothetical protein
VRSFIRSCLHEKEKKKLPGSFFFSSAYNPNFFKLSMLIFALPGLSRHHPALRHTIAPTSSEAAKKDAGPGCHFYLGELLFGVFSISSGDNGIFPILTNVIAGSKTAYFTQ